ncbi:barstar family protein [Leifsonia sp. LS-T14]|uniref:barstar family protein n=1 Tax=unclassified Leifsonia TaxID=2663824 RepID=UPI0035A5A0CC
MHDAISLAFGFPGYYGRNLAALRDCLSDVAELDYGWTEADAGLIIVLDNFDRIHAAMPVLAVTLLDIISEAALRAALLGNRLVCLVRSDDRGLELGRIGGYDPTWNPREWLLRDRTD